MGKLQTHNVAKDVVVSQLVNFYEQIKFDRVTKLRARVDNYCKWIVNERGSHLYGGT